MSRLRTLLRRRGPGLACQDLVETITDYLDDAMTPRRRRAFETHLAACADCRAYVAQFEATIAASGRAPAPDALDPAERDALLAAFHAWTGPGTST